MGTVSGTKRVVVGLYIGWPGVVGTSTPTLMKRA